MPKFIHLLPDMIDIKSPTYPQDIQLTLRRKKQLLWWDISEVMTDHWKTKCSFNSHALNLITISERAGAQSKSFNLISKFLIGLLNKYSLKNISSNFRKQCEININWCLCWSCLCFMVNMFSSKIIF